MCKWVKRLTSVSVLLTLDYFPFTSLLLLTLTLWCSCDLLVDWSQATSPCFFIHSIHTNEEYVISRLLKKIKVQIHCQSLYHTQNNMHSSIWTCSWPTHFEGKPDLSKPGPLTVCLPPPQTLGLAWKGITVMNNERCISSIKLTLPFGRQPIILNIPLWETHK